MYFPSGCLRCLSGSFLSSGGLTFPIKFALKRPTGKQKEEAMDLCGERGGVKASPIPIWADLEDPQCVKLCHFFFTSPSTDSVCWFEHWSAGLLHAWPRAKNHRKKKILCKRHIYTKLSLQRKTKRCCSLSISTRHRSLPMNRHHLFIRTKDKLKKYSRTLLFRTRLIRSPRYFEGRSNSLGFTLTFSVIYYQLFRTRLFQIPRYFELIVLSLHLN